MREVLAEEHGQLAHVSRPRDQGGGRRDRGGGGGGIQKSASLKLEPGRAGGLPPGKKARKESESLSPLRAREKRNNGLTTELSAEYGSPQHRRTGGGGGAMAMPDFVDAEPAGRGGQERQERSAGGKAKGKMSQILPPYLRGAVPQRSGGGGVRFQTGEGSPRDGGGSWRGGGLSDALSATAPSGGDPMRTLDVGDATAYPLLGFDAELPSRNAGREPLPNI